MKRIDITKILEKCPKDMELDSIIHEDPVLFKSITPAGEITCTTKNNVFFYVNRYGELTHYGSCKCVIYPKDKTTWEGFVPPYKFNDGDVLAAYECLVLFKKLDGINIKCYCTYHFMNNSSFHVDTLQNKDAFRPATEEEKQKLFKAIKEYGYHWNAETKTLERIAKLKFKVGDRIQWCGTHANRPVRIIKSIELDRYRLDNGNYIKFSDEHAYKVLKFDINTLKPFESKVLVRDTEREKWKPAV